MHGLRLTDYLISNRCGLLVSRVYINVMWMIFLAYSVTFFLDNSLFKSLFDSWEWQQFGFGVRSYEAYAWLRVSLKHVYQLNVYNGKYQLMHWQLI